MSEIRHDLLETVDRVCETFVTREVLHAAEQGRWPSELWDALEETGLVRALVPEAAGGSGLPFDDAMAVLKRCAYHALPLPLAETMLAGRLLLAAGLDVPMGALTVAGVDVPMGARTTPDALRFRRAAGGGHVSGITRRVPWGEACGHIVVVGLDDAGAACLGVVSAGHSVRAIERNLAAESRATLEFESAPLMALAPFEGGLERLLLEGALVRSVQMSGALERVLALSLRYANERVQFGKPIGRFQAVQHMLAVLAGQVAAASAVSDLAIEAGVVRAEPFTVAVAKARVGEAAGKGAEIGHQVHGAMGFTLEHALHHSTRRLWSWRDEFGNEAYWQERIGRSVAAAGADALWPTITGGSPRP